MTATASLEDYIKHFKQDYQRYLSSDTSSISSMDTDELLSDISSETSSKSSRLPKNSIKSIKSLKKKAKKAKVNQPPHLKPLHSTPLKMIQEEEEFYDSHYKLSDYMPGTQVDINEYLPKARAAKNQKVKEILASLDVESENMSIISSVDTEALLQSSDEEDYTPKKLSFIAEKPKSFKKPEIKKFSSEKTIKNTQKEDFSFSSKDSKSPVLTLAKSQVLSFVPKRFSTQTLSLSISNEKKPSKYSSFANSANPSSFFNSLSPNTKKPSKMIKICSCILSGSVYSHFSNCTPATIIGEVESIKLLPKKQKISLVDGVVLIQRAFRKYLSKNSFKPLKTKTFEPKKFSMDFATKTLNEAFKELENLKNLASDRSSEVSKDFQDYQINAKDGLRNSYEPSEVDTEELLNSSFSSILSRN